MKSRIFQLFQKSKTVCPVPKKLLYDKDRGLYYFLEPIKNNSNTVNQSEPTLKDDKMVVFTLKGRN